MGFIGSLVPLLLLAGIIWAIVWFVRKRRETAVDVSAAPGGVRRVAYYLIAFAALMISANGFSLIIQSAMDALRGETVLADNRQQLAMGLALALVAAPVWLVFWTLVQRSINKTAAEVHFLARKAYLYIVLASGLVYLGTNLPGLLTAALGSEFRTAEFANSLVWVFIWAYHWWVQAHDARPVETGLTVKRLYIYLASAGSAAIMLAGLGLVVHHFLLGAYEALFQQRLVLEPTLWTTGAKESTAAAIVGAAGWVWHWQVAARSDSGTLVRQAYLWLVGVLAGVLALAAAAGLVVNAVVSWALGEPGIISTADHFRPIVAGVALVLVATAILSNHLPVIRREESADPTGTSTMRRVFRYLAGVTGLATIATGTSFLISLVIGVVVPESRQGLTGEGWWKSQLSVAVTLLFAGGPLLAFPWLSIEKAIRCNILERQEVARRAFTYAVFAIALIASVASLSTAIFFVLRDTLEGTLALEVLQGARWGIGAFVAAAGASALAWAVIRTDQSNIESAGVVPVEARRKKTVVMVAPVSSLADAARLEALLGYHVRVWQRSDLALVGPSMSEEQLEEAAEQVSNTRDDQVLVMLGEQEIKVVPFVPTGLAA